MHALVIDDSRALRRILGEMLRQLGFTVDEAGNGREGLEALRNSPLPLPDIALVDWNMPVMNGLEFVQAVRADASLAGLPLMMVTTETELAQMATALEAGANEYVMKPFNKEVIADKLAILGVLC
jgi:two-component system chemotaxis response regulator CheY